MKVAEAKELVLTTIQRDLTLSRLPVIVDHRSPDGDPGKFVLDGKTARAIHHFDGWYVQINLDWFEGSYDPPEINKGKFYWYVFAIPTFDRYTRSHYLICDYLQIRDWVLEFAAPLGRDHKHHKDWRATINIDRGQADETQAYFRWGDEPIGRWQYPSRIVRIDNIDVVPNANNLQQHGLHVGATGPTGESEAHKRLKLYVAKHPNLLSLSPTAIADVEHKFITGDIVDVLFSNHGPLRTVAEIELSGTQNIIVGIHQAIKYRSLAAAEANINLYNIVDPRAHVVSYETGGPQASKIAEHFNVNLVTVDKEIVLMPEE